MSEWQCYKNNDELDQALCREHIAARLQDDIASYGQASLAVSGGGTPKNMFRLLSHTELDWARVWVTLVDERWVGAEHAEYKRTTRAGSLATRGSSTS